jgi:hypothetical protein
MNFNKLKVISDSLGSVISEVKDKRISTAREQCVKSLAKRRILDVAGVLGLGVIDKVDFVMILGVRGMMERKYRRETIIEKCQVTLSSYKRLEVTSKVLEEL